MARTINFEFAQGGGQVIPNGDLTIEPTQNWVSGAKVVVPSSDPIPLINGQATVTNVEPTPTAADGWRYQVQLVTPDRKIHMWVVEVPTGTTPINFSACPVVVSMTIPLGVTGLEMERWVDSVHSHAAAANTNAVNALTANASLTLRVEALEEGGGGGGGGYSGPGTMISVNQSGGSYTRPTSDPDLIYVFVGSADPGSVAKENDRWERI